VLPSPNGSRLSVVCNDVHILAGCLRNAAAVARAARRLAANGNIGVVPAGERWPDGSLRPAIEDLLAAGAILSHIELPRSPEAQIARDVYRSAGHNVGDLIRASVSGRELADMGFAGDVEIALEENVSLKAPVLIDGAYRPDRGY
jgi:2-phosphosulfolactate phosphatase